MWGRRLFSTAVILMLSAGVVYAARGPRPGDDRRNYLEKVEKELDSFEEKFDVLRVNSEAQTAPSESYMEMDDLELLAKDIRGDLVTLASAPESGWTKLRHAVDAKLEELHRTLTAIVSAPAKNKIANAK